MPESIGHSIQNTYYPSSVGTAPQNYPDAILLDYNTGDTSGTQSRSFLNVSAEYLAQSQQLSDWVLERMGKKQQISGVRPQKQLYGDESAEQTTQSFEG